MVTVVNSDVDIRNPEEVERAMVTRCDPASDIIIVPGAFGHELNPVLKDNVGAKMGFDCTCPLPRSPRYEKVAYKNVSLKDYIIE